MHHTPLQSAFCCAFFLLLASGCGQKAVEPPSASETPESRPQAEAAAEPAENPLWIDIPNAKMPFEGILTGGQPTPEQVEEAARAGYRTVVNLRTPGEKGSWDEAPKAAELGLAYFDLPISGGDDLTPENARKLSEIVSSAESLPAMVHCASGNRVGALFAIKAFHVDGEDAETAMRQGLEAGLTRLEKAVEERLVPADP